MKKIKLSVLTLLMLCAAAFTVFAQDAAPDYTNALNNLKVFKEAYPKSFFFRPSESTYEPYEQWEKEFSRLTGIQGKAQDEELDKSANIEYFSRFKKNNPDQLVVLHYNGNARDPMDNTEEFFAGHWLYFVGTNVLTDIPANDTITTIKVVDAEAFLTQMGRYNDRNEDIGICEVDENGKPDWHKSEQVQLLSVDKPNNTITVRRGMYGTQAKAFKATKTYAASHVTEGPWGSRHELLWAYNYSTVCPKDDNGDNCGDVLARELTHRFSAEGELAAFDGIEFDILHNTLNPLYGGWGKLSPGDRFPDSNADGKADVGFFDGINTYGIGVVEFLQKLRSGLGDEKLILADGGSPTSQRGFGILNGIESEGWPRGNDYEFHKWSDGLNRLLFWKENSRKPTLIYINHRWWRKSGKDLYTPFSRQRMVIAASALTATTHSLFNSPPSENKQLGIWDEIKKGTENQLGWLGQPVGPAIRLAQQQTELLNFKSRSFIRNLKRVNPDFDIVKEQDMIKIAPKSDIEGSMLIHFPTVPCEDEDFLMLMTLSGDINNAYPKGWARLAKLSLDSTVVPEESMTYLNPKPFLSAFYFTGVHEMSVKPKLTIEGAEPVYISNIEAYAHPDVMFREFENGLVIANPSNKNYEINMSDMFPGKTYRRLTGSPKQDPEFNNGQQVIGKLTLNKKDAIFLIKEE